MVLKSCPSCGSRRAGYVFSDYVIRLRKGHRVVVPALRRLRCRKCGEQVFDAEAGQVIDHFLSKDPVWQARRRALHKRVTAGQRPVSEAA